MNTQPHAVGNDAFELVTMLTDFGDGGILPDHRHDAFVAVVECGTRLARDIGKDVPGRPASTLLCHGTELRQGILIRSQDMREVAQRIDAREALDAEIVLYVDSAAATLRQSGAECHGRRLETRAPDCAMGLDRAAVG